MALVTTGTPRFRAALEPFLVLWAAIGVVTVARALIERRKPVAGRRERLSAQSNPAC